MKMKKFEDVTKTTLSLHPQLLFLPSPQFFTFPRWGWDEAIEDWQFGKEEEDGNEDWGLIIRKFRKRMNKMKTSFSPPTTTLPPASFVHFPSYFPWKIGNLAEPDLCMIGDDNKDWAWHHEIRMTTRIEDNNEDWGWKFGKRTKTTLPPPTNALPSSCSVCPFVHFPSSSSPPENSPLPTVAGH